MRRQAVHKESRFAGFSHQFLIDLVGLENARTFRRFVFLSHAGPDVGVNRIRAFHRINFRRPRNILARRRAIALRADRAETDS